MADILVCRAGDIAEGGVRVVKAGEVEIGVIRQAGKYYAYRHHSCQSRGFRADGLRYDGRKKRSRLDIRTRCSILIVFIVIGGRGRLFSPGAGALVRVLSENDKRRRT